MANLFEKPIAANPISEFAALPLDFIYNAVQNRQNKYDAVKADIEATEESLLGLKFLAGDRDRHMELQQGIEQEMDDMIEASGGDYSLIQAPLDRLKRKIQKDIAYGEFGAQQKAYDSAMADYEVLNKRHLEGNVTDGGMQRFNKSMQEHRTQLNDMGSWASFNGYSPSNITNVTSHLIDEARKINDKFDPNGTQYINSGDILANVSGQMLADPNIEKSLQEAYLMSGSEGTYEDFVDGVLKSVSHTVAYERNLLAGKKGASGKEGDMGTPQGSMLLGVQQPFMAGTGTYQGGSAAEVKELLQSFTGKNAANDFTKWRNSDEGKELVNRLMQRHGIEEFPQGLSDQVNLLNELISKPLKSDVIVRQATPDETLAFDTKGQGMYPTSAVFDMEGGQTTVSDIQGQSGDKSRVTQISGVVDVGAPGTPPGTYVVVGKDAQTYFMENNSYDNITSTPYLDWQIESVKHTNTWENNVTLKAGLPSDVDPNQGLPAGQYQIEYHPAEKDGEGNYIPEGYIAKSGNTEYMIYRDGNNNRVIKKL